MNRAKLLLRALVVGLLGLTATAYATEELSWGLFKSLWEGAEADRMDPAAKLTISASKAGGSGRWVERVQGWGRVDLRDGVGNDQIGVFGVDFSVGITAFKDANGVVSGRMNAISNYDVGAFFALPDEEVRIKLISKVDCLNVVGNVTYIGSEIVSSSYPDIPIGARGIAIIKDMGPQGDIMHAEGADLDCNDAAAVEDFFLGINTVVDQGNYNGATR